jgi:hypothetical protein
MFVILETEGFSELVEFKPIDDNVGNLVVDWENALEKVKDNPEWSITDVIAAMERRGWIVSFKDSITLSY